MIRLGIVGCNYGRTVQLPAFRKDPRCTVVALAGTDQSRTAELARQSGISAAFGDWHQLLERADIDAVSIATPPQLQPAIAIRAFELGKAVFVEKPMAADLDGASAMLRAAAGKVAIIDFNFTEGKGTIRIGDIVSAEMQPYTDAQGRPTKLVDSIFSTIPGSPAFLGTV